MCSAPADDTIPAATMTRGIPEWPPAEECGAKARSSIVAYYLSGCEMEPMAAHMRGNASTNVNTRRSGAIQW